MKRLSLFVVAFVMIVMFQGTFLQAQDLVHYKQLVSELSSSKYQGRGYAYGGANKAGKYLKKEFSKAGVDEVVCQPFKLDINTFPGKMDFSVDGKKQVPGVDFVMREFSPGVHGSYKLYYVDTLNYNPEKIFSDLAKPENKDVFVVCDFWFIYKHRADFYKMETDKGCANAGMIYTWNEPLKFYKAYGEQVVTKPIIWVSANFPQDAQSITANIDIFTLFEQGVFISHVPASCEDLLLPPGKTSRQPAYAPFTWNKQRMAIVCETPQNKLLEQLVVL